MLNKRTAMPKGFGRQQQGAVLYIALILLIILALLGIAGMQVTGLQERMSSNYRAANLAFQRAEGLARQVECGIENDVNRTSLPGCVAVADVNVCDKPFDPVAWADGNRPGNGEQTNVRLIGPCISGNSSLGMGAVENEDPNPIYQITAYNVDQAGDNAADAAVDTIFRP